MLDTVEPRLVGVTRRTSLHQALVRCRCRMGSGDAGHGDSRSEALKWRSHTTPEAVACSVLDSVVSVGMPDDVRREHDTAGGYEHEPVTPLVARFMALRSGEGTSA